MTHDDPLIRALVRLLSSAGRVPTAEFSASERSALVEFSRSNGGLRLVMVGRKSDYAITNRAALERHINQLQPGVWVPEAPASFTPAATAEADPGAAEGCYLLLKAISPDARWIDDSANPPRTLILAPLQQATGVVALALKYNDAWHTTGLLWLVERQSQFDSNDWLPAGASGTLAYCVAPDRRTLQQWLAHRQRAQALRHVTAVTS